MAGTAKEWDGAAVRKWLESRVVAARSDQVAAERGGRDRQDDCDKATAEEMVCSFLKGSRSVDAMESFSAELRSLLDRDDYIWRGVYDDARFDRHVRTYIKKLARMTKTNDGFGNIAHYQ
ncbi:hypothetical protein [Sphingomonas mollis]|uniref:Uncharacterized protein n=1 Tax=Sphingomonas mollis TaxID=2795726 RepID=A0ABS0XMG9_9SPHN|nr:hypothetical protein [Sphingomonas sp. BT553]MBJ6120965.1 hypothetical protein [Sphingomonas sp. BT553]